MITFEAWPKTPRLFRDMIVTEKIDGTNAAVIIEPHHGEYDPSATLVIHPTEGRMIVGAQSRKRLITPDADNFGFARWVYDNAADLAHLLGPGRHFGEWWGSGIQRGYGLTNGEKRFSLFNVNRYAGISGVFKDVDVVPTLYTGPFDLAAVEGLLYGLMNRGSTAAPGFMRPEGVVVYHEAAGQTFKALIENDSEPKGTAA